ncbi:hypothetical protein H0H92_015489 [Tricholoma furcatifolium]|nr:hypothetical protein H0H92_015489 [Tricholoma furcatifolium]
MLYVSGERLPDTSYVAPEYLESLKRHSLTVPGSRNLPRVILLGGGNVESFSVQPEYLHALAKRPHHRTNPAPSRRIVAQRAHYNELRFGKFCRKLRLPPGTKASDVEGSFINGMLLLSWPRASGPEASDQSGQMESTNVSIPITVNVNGPVAVKVESVEPMSID